MRQGMAISGVGMVTSVGYDAPSSAVALHAGLCHFQETEFFFGGAFVQGAPVSLSGLRGVEKLVEMARLAVEECLGPPPEGPLEEVPLLFCAPASDRPGAPDAVHLWAELNAALSPHLRLSKSSECFASGRTAGIQALARARTLLAAGASSCLLVGADSYLSTDTLEALFETDRLAHLEQDGLIPGEAAAAVRLSNRAPAGSAPQLWCKGMALTQEPAPFGSGAPFRAEGLFQALRQTLADAGCTFAEVDYRISDLNGEPERFKEVALGLTRAMRIRKETFELWSPAESLGEVGAAAVPVAMAVAYQALRFGYAPGAGVLCHFSSDGSERGALLLRAEGSP